ncbi:MAG TPA: GNAT family N-acetyltransferase, partial [Chitinophagales bacterium]|nr:GNAT family N-acetyltransferase [Chitinophagales bacterium]
ATNPDSRGHNLVAQIASWATTYARNNGKQFVRMDTVGNNEGLIKHYTRCGFTFLGLLTLKNTAGLPAHYHNATVSLFELKVAEK